MDRISGNIPSPGGSEIVSLRNPDPIKRKDYRHTKQEIADSRLPASNYVWSTLSAGWASAGNGCQCRLWSAKKGKKGFSLSPFLGWNSS